ncbi:MAG: NAD-dependent epimerase/dehydratase family protein [Nocardioidaceae bacterium]
MVYTSSSAVFGIPKSNPVFPDTPPTPVEAYGQAKFEGELLCRAAVSRGLDVSIVRPRTILGLGRLGIFGILFDWIADGAAVPVLGKGDNHLPVRACSRPRDRMHPGRATQRTRHLQHRCREVRHDARGR